MLHAIFAVSAVSILYVYFGYPGLLWLWVRLRPHQQPWRPDTPSVSLIIAAYNEAAIIDKKLRNSEALDYPRERIEILVASDGSSDATVSLAHTFGNRVRVLDLPRLGKIPALYAAIREASGEIVVFSDANTMLDRDALRALVGYFADPTAGCVCGNQKHVDPEADGDVSGLGESLYWRYDKLIKWLESRSGGTIAADGALYAVRRNLLIPIGNPAQADDMAISINVARQNRRIVFAEDALCYEVAPSGSAEEFRRKVRIANHSLSALLDPPSILLSGADVGYRVKLWSHKMLRYLVPVFMIAAYASSAWLGLYSWPYSVLWVLQSLFYGAAILGYLMRGRPVGRNRVLYVPFFFCLANLAALLAIIQRIRGRTITRWDASRSR